MRWIWIDRIVELQPKQRCVSVKAVTAAEDVLHDHFPADAGGDGRPPRGPLPLMPNSLVIEGMAQTAGILVGHAGGFREKVILAKIGRATFHADARPGFVIRHTAELTQFSDAGAATTGTSELIDPADGSTRPLADVQLVFSHIDRNRAGLAFPEHNFVFTGQFLDLLRDAGVELPAPSSTPA